MQTGSRDKNFQYGILIIESLKDGDDDKRLSPVPTKESNSAPKNCFNETISLHYTNKIISLSLFQKTVSVTFIKNSLFHIYHRLTYKV